MTRGTCVFLLLACAAFAASGACSSSSDDSSSPSGGGTGTDGGGGTSDAGGGGGGGGDDGGSAGETGPSYGGGDVTVTLSTQDGGTVATDAVTGKVTLHFTATTPSAISKIDALVDGKTVGIVTATPFDVQWDSSLVGNGAHTISGTVYDLAQRTGTAKSLAITTNNFLLAGTWTWSGVTDAELGKFSDSCSSTTFTVTFDQGTQTMTFPSFYLSCSAQNGASYSSQIHGFTKVVTAADYGGPITNTAGTVTTTFSTTSLRQSDSFNTDTQSGTLTRAP